MEINENKREGAITLNNNPLATKPIPQLLVTFAAPSIVALLVSTVYNLVDQFFIGNTVGALGNAATNIQFPLTNACIAIALLFGVGGAAAFNLAMGESTFKPELREKAADYMGNAVFGMVACGLILLLVTQLFLSPLLQLFGAPENVLPYARTYTRIVSWGFPFQIWSTGCGALLRADGTPKAQMTCNLLGAGINIVLDALFLMVFHWGMAGAAAATVIGQVIAAALVANYMLHTKTVKLRRQNLHPKGQNLLRIVSLGFANATNQVAMMVVLIVMNNSLKYYGDQSVYGASVTIAVAGIISKVNMLYMAVVIGTAQGLQPIASFNFGARNYERVRKAILMALGGGLVISVLAFGLFQLFPRNIIGVFGSGTKEYFAFAERYFRIYLFFTFLNFVQPITSNSFTAIGSPGKGAVLSLTRQILFLLPLLLVLPLFWGIDGILYAGPIADGAAALACAALLCRELKKNKYWKPEAED